MRRLLDRLMMEAKEQAHRDYAAYLQRVEAALDASGVPYDATPIGQSPAGDILLYRPLDEERPGRRILCLSGQHGEEIAAPWALLGGLQRCPEVLRDHHISVLPVVNPTGFARGTRAGDGGKNTSWVLDDRMRVRPAEAVGPEVRALIEHLDLLVGDCAVDGLLNLHEDNTSQGFYLYVLGDARSAVVGDMLREGSRFFAFKKDGTYRDNGTYELRDGVVDNHQDHSIDCYAYREGTPMAITIELPAVKGVEFDVRVRAGARMMEAFLRGMTSGGSA